MILVTGATGFLGGCLIQALARSGVRARGMYRNSPPQFQHELIEYIQADLLCIDELEIALEGITHIYHCASMVSFDPADDEALLKNNVEGTANLVNIAIEKKIAKLIYVSSVASLGRTEIEPIHEGTDFVYQSGLSTYAYSKFLGENEVWRGYYEGLPVAIVNPSVIIGKGDADRSSLALIKQAYNEFAYYTLGVNGFVGADDIVRAMILLMNSSIVGERFILNEGNYSYKDILTRMAKALGKRPPYKNATPLMGKLAAVYFQLRKLFTGKKALITTHTARMAQSQYSYLNNKFLEHFPEFNYTPIQAVIEEACQHFSANR